MNIPIISSFVNCFQARKAIAEPSSATAYAHIENEYKSCQYKIETYNTITRASVLPEQIETYKKLDYTFKTFAEHSQKLAKTLFVMSLTGWGVISKVYAHNLFIKCLGANSTLAALYIAGNLFIEGEQMKDRSAIASYIHSSCKKNA